MRARTISFLRLTTGRLVEVSGFRFQVSGNEIEGANRSRGEAGETIHHLFMAKLKGYITEKSASFIS